MAATKKRDQGKISPIDVSTLSGEPRGADDDWASWYADWLISLSELPALLGIKPVRSELVYLLVSLDKEHTAGQQDQPWEAYYASRLLGHFNSGR